AESIRVLVTGAAGQITYSLLYSIAKGDVFGKDQYYDGFTVQCIELINILKPFNHSFLLPRFFISEFLLKTLLYVLSCDSLIAIVVCPPSVLMPLSVPFVAEVIPTDKVDVAFKDLDAAILVGSMPRREGMERKDLLKANVAIFKSQGEALDKYAKKTVKVLVVGNPANTNCLIAAKSAPSIPKENFSCLTRLDHNRACSQVAMRCGISANSVKNMIIWGNHSSTQYPDIHHCKVNVQGTVQQRGAAVIKARKLSSAMSAAKAICDHMRDIWTGTTE
ncbi:malate dehydrogenase, cytoplasmic-like, partial [Sinocyclocheilus grahami]|uniref:malate dehydrogenase, cytoplasmic-like n=1 Tax=Sinocyclocheilus grahami TaxID=75366 RepID=UPI0007ACC922